MVKRTSTIHLFHCVNSMTEAELQDLQSRLGADALKTLSLPCSGKATIPYLLKAFEKGADGVVLCICPESQCKHLEGNFRASRRAEAVGGVLEEIGFGAGRVLVVTKEQGRSEAMIDGVQQLRAKLDRMQPSETEPGRTVLSGVRTGDRRENAA
jgi:coenzyme F420-reducing hydrogenase delta subunit